MNLIDLTDCRCVRCNASQLVLVKEPGIDQVASDVVSCPSCGSLYDVCWGVPFLGFFQESDLFGLMEIVANAAEYGGSDRVDLDLDPIIVKYHFSEFRSGLVATDEQIKRLGEFLPHRYREWLEVCALTYEIDLQGKKVLDVGAGIGFDAKRLVKRGAQVTALEYNPVLARLGSLSLPEARWIGGLSHAIPFVAGCFDLVLCNAALHHMRDIPAALTEMLRVLKPGGLLITTSDPYTSDDCTESRELAVFDSHEGVLRGINEQTPRLAEYLRPIHRYRSSLVPALFTHQVGNFPCARPGATSELGYLRQWDFDRAGEVLTSTWGSIALKVRLTSAIPVEPAQQNDQLVTPGNFASWLENKSVAMAHLAKLIPENLVNLPFPGEDSSRFLLLNGWKGREPGVDYRQAFGSARWFLRRSQQQEFLSLEVLAPDTGHSPEARLRFTIDGGTSINNPVVRGLWTRFMLPISHIPADENFAVEVGLLTESSLHSERVFKVRALRLDQVESVRRSTPEDIEQVSLSTLLDLMSQSKEKLSVLFHPHQEEMFQVIASLRNRGIFFSAIIPSGQEFLFSSQGIAVEMVYQDFNVAGSVQRTLACDPDIIVAPSLEEALRLVASVETVGQKGRFAVFADGAVEVLSPDRIRKQQECVNTALVVSELRVLYKAARHLSLSAALPLLRILFNDPRIFGEIVYLAWKRVGRFLKRPWDSTKAG